MHSLRPATALWALALIAAVSDAFSIPSRPALAPPPPAPRPKVGDRRVGTWNPHPRMTAALDPRTGSFLPPVDVTPIRVEAMVPRAQRAFAAGVSGQFVLIASAVLSYALVATAAPVSLMALFDQGILLPFVDNLTPAALCFGGADVVTQLVSSREEQKRAGTAIRVDAWRSLSASLVGILCNAIGLTVWLHFLNPCLPSSSVGGLARGKLPLLVAKTMTHAFVWGTLSNSASLVLRRMLAGDSPNMSVAFWNSKIMQVTRSNMAFWPVWMLVNFALVPQAMQVRVTAVGAFCFNIFMSYVSSQRNQPACPAEPVPPPAPALAPAEPAGGRAWDAEPVFDLGDVIGAARAANSVAPPPPLGARAPQKGEGGSVPVV